MAGMYDRADKAFIFFNEKLKKNEPFELSEVAEFAGWKAGTVKTYPNKQWKSFLEKNGKKYLVRECFSSFTKKSFRKHHSQKGATENEFFYDALVNKAVCACVSAIEIYNKPDFKFREESFSILMVNAWELLLKAKILKANNDEKESIYFKKGKEVVYTDSGNPKTIAISKAINILESKGILNKIAIDNVKLLIEIRDESVHFVHVDSGLAEKIQAIGMAALKNFMALSIEWFGTDFGKYNFYLMPVSFFYEPSVTAINIDQESRINLRKHLEKVIETHEGDNDPQFSISLTLETKLVKTTNEEALPITVTSDPSAPKVNISEEDFLKSYPYTHAKLIELLKARYNDFKQNKKFNELMKELRAEGEFFCKERRLDPNNPKSLYKRYYHSRILEEFDKHYTKV